MGEAWASFARSSKPGHRGLPAWPAYTNENRATMVFNDPCQIADDPDGEVRPLWGNIATASLDPFRGYATALAAQLPNTIRVLDAFHVVKLAMTCVDELRRRTQQDTFGHRGHAQDPLYRTRRLLRRRADRLTITQHTKLLAALLAGDPNDEVTAAWSGSGLHAATLMSLDE